MIRDWLLTLDADYMRSASPTCTLLSRRASFARLPPPARRSYRIVPGVSWVCPGCTPGVAQTHTTADCCPPSPLPVRFFEVGATRQHANTPNGQTAPFRKSTRRVRLPHDEYDGLVPGEGGSRLVCMYPAPPFRLPAAFTNGECPARLLCPHAVSGIPSRAVPPPQTSFTVSSHPSPVIVSLPVQKPSSNAIPLPTPATTHFRVSTPLLAHALGFERTRARRPRPRPREHKTRPRELPRPRTFFRSTITWKRWKSLSDARLALVAIFLAHPVAAHFASTSAASSALRRVDARGSTRIATLNGVRERRRNGSICRETRWVGSADGPSTRTRDWSTTLMMVQSLLRSGP